MKAVIFLIILCWLLSCVLVASLGRIKTLKLENEKLKFENQPPKCKNTETEKSENDKKLIKNLKNFYAYDGTEQS